MQKKYSSDNTVYLTKEDLNTPVSMVSWLKENFSEIKTENIEPKDLSSALEGILRDRNFTQLSNKKQNEFIGLLNTLKTTLKTLKKLP